MLTIGGLVFLFVCVFGSYVTAGGSMEPLIEAVPFEMWTIGGAAVSGFVMSNSLHAAKHTLGTLGKAIKGRRLREGGLHRIAEPAVFPGLPCQHQRHHGARAAHREA